MAALLKKFLLLWAMLSPLIWAQDAAVPALSDRDPIRITIEHYLVSELRDNDGSFYERFALAKTAKAGDIIEYRLSVTHEGTNPLAAGTVMITTPIPSNMSYLFATATPSSASLLTEFSADSVSFARAPLFKEDYGERIVIEPEAYVAIRWTMLHEFLPKQQESFSFRVVVNSL